MRQHDGCKHHGAMWAHENLDPENTGFIAVENFTSLVEHHELQLDPSKLDMLLAIVQNNEEGQVCYQELIELMSSKRSSSFRRAIANGRRTLQREILLDETGLDYCVYVLWHHAKQVGTADLSARLHEEPLGLPSRASCTSVALFQLHVHARRFGAAGLQCFTAADDWRSFGDGPWHLTNKSALHGRSASWLSDSVHHGHARSSGGWVRGSLCSLLSASGQRCHELGRDALSIQAAPHDPGTSLHEFGGGPCSLAPLLTTTALLRAPAQLHGTSFGGRGRYQHGAADPAQLRGESAEAVLLVGHRLLLHHIPALCHLLEHLRI
ncbi:rhomboid-related protein 1 isoform X4 [Channa argus]|uniref:rhomboid-related protein 1 isoform X4 n=1 Tax=Channa argus TaxID=215402 RepID=UPI00352186EF